MKYKDGIRRFLTENKTKTKHMKYKNGQISHRAGSKSKQTKTYKRRLGRTLKKIV